MTYSETIKKLKAAGTAQNRKVYARHGVSGEQFGVSFAELNKLKKQIKLDHELATRLWQTGNHDARILACMIADPDQLKSAELDAWAKELDNYVITDAFAEMVARSKHAPAKEKKWSKAAAEFVGQAGWDLVARSASRADVADAQLESYLKTIETKIHKAKNRVRHSMNNALISIGVRNAALEKKAVAAAKRIGKVEVDHGETSCKTPDAIAYIAKTKAHRAKKKTKAKAR